MPLTVGSTLGPYEIIALIGRGGMGEVYRARDPRLGRDVAIKVSAEQFSDRFDREARAIASLNHPSICQIYDVGPNYLVMELVEGETLAGPLSFATALDYARQIAEALEAAHEKGIVHRDLKPENVKVTSGGVIKLLDFGLAKALEQDPRTVSTADSPTLSLSSTRVGTILGTPAYMSPEQARGKPVDRRADIWAFGALFFEMLTGKQLFIGDTAADILASIIKAEAKLDDVPAAARPLIERCLIKDPRRRLQAIGEARIMLEDGLAGVSATVPRAPARPRFAWAAVALVVLAIICGVLSAVIYFRNAPQTRPVLEYTVLPPANSAVHSFSISPDGELLAIAATVEGKRSLWVRVLGSLQARELPGTDGAAMPFWSPDGRFIAFSAQRSLKKVSVEGGPPQVVVSDSPSRTSWPGSWNRDGVIVFATLQRVSASGGVPARVVARDDVSVYPVFLPDGARFLFSVLLSPHNRGIHVGSLRSTESRRLLDDVSNTAYSPPRKGSPNGHVIFVRDGALMAQPVDPSEIKTVGEAFPIVEQVAPGVNLSSSQFSLSQNDVLVYEARRAAAGGRLTWFDRSGRELGFATDPGRIFDFALAPDDKRVAIARADNQYRTSDLWIRDIARATEIRFTSNPSLNERPVWSPDGETIFFSSTRSGRTDLFRKSASASVEETSVFHDNTAKLAMEFCGSGKLLLYQSQTGIFSLALSGNSEPIGILTSRFALTQAQLSPDCRWLAYVSDESGRNEVYVQPFSSDGAPPFKRWTISNSGASDPRWRRDGKELFYLSGNGKLMVVPVESSVGNAFQTGSPQPLFDVPSFGGTLAIGSFRYAVASDGRRVLALIGPKDAFPAPLTVITDWRAAVKK